MYLRVQGRRDVFWHERGTSAINGETPIQRRPRDEEKILGNAE